MPKKQRQRCITFSASPLSWKLANEYCYCLWILNLKAVFWDAIKVFVKIVKEEKTKFTIMIFKCIYYDF